MASNKIYSFIKFLISIFAIIGFFSLLYFWGQLSSSDKPEGIPSSEKPTNSERAQVDSINFNFHYDFPSKIYNTNYQIFPVVFDVNNELYRRAYYYKNTSTNIVIYNSKTDKGHIVFDKLARIDAIDYPSKKEDSLQNIIIFNCIPFDSNNDGFVNGKDKNILFYSELDGSNLIQITPDSLNVIKYKKTDRNNTLVIQVSNEKPKKYGRDDEPSHVIKKLLWYDIKNRNLYKKDELSKLLNIVKDKFPK